MKRLAHAIFVTLLLLAAPAAAQTLEQAKAQGLVGERPDGLLGIVRQTSEIQALVRGINGQRLDQYRDIATRTGTSLPAVQAIAGEKAIAQSPSGSYVMDSSGNWRRK